MSERPRCLEASPVDNVTQAENLTCARRLHLRRLKVSLHGEST